MREGVWQCAGGMEAVLEHYRNNSRCICRIAVHISGYDSFFYWLGDGSLDVSACMYDGAKM